MPATVDPPRTNRFARWAIRCILPHTLTVVAVLVMVHTALPPFWGSPGLAYKVDLAENAESGYDRVFVGSSHLFRQVVPHLLDSALNDGSRSFVVALNAVYSPEADIACEHILRCAHPPREVFIELMPFSSFDERSFDNYRSWYYVDAPICAMLVRHHFAQTGIAGPERISRIWNDMRAFAYAASMPGARDRFAGAGRRMDTATVMGPALDGHVPFEWQWAREPGNVNLRERQEALRRDTAEVGRRAEAIARAYAVRSGSALSHVHKEHIDKLIRLADERGVGLRFILPPLWPVKEESTLALFNSLPPERRIDLCDPALYPEFYRLTNIFDAGHLNSKGSRLFTLRLADLISGQDRSPGGRATRDAGCFASFADK